MKVAMYYNNQDVRIEEMEKPKPKNGELLVKVAASGICGSDVLEWYRLKKAPLVLGHEISGEIVELGQGVTKYKVGQRVFVSHHVPCDNCHYCLNGYHTACSTLHTTNFYPGGFSEYVLVPKINVEKGVFILPQEISYESATFIEPLACVLRAQRLAGIKPDQTVLIIGSGISGLIHLLAAKAQGAKRVFTSDVNLARLKLARELGADNAVSAAELTLDKVRQWNQGRLADLVIVCTGALSAFKQSLQTVDRGGTVLFFACTEPGVDLAVPLSDFWRNQIKLMTSYANAPADAQAAIEQLKSSQINLDKLITHRLPLSQAVLGFKLTSAAQDCLKVIIKP